MIGTNALRHRMVRDGTVEHAAYRNPVDRSALHAEADKATREDVDYDHNPVTAQEDGFAAEQVNTPQAVLGLGEKGQPGWAIGSRGTRLVMFGEDATHHVLVETDTERMANLLGNPQMAESRVSGFHLNDCCDQFGRWALWPGLPTGSGGREQSPVLVIDQKPVEPEQCARFEDHGQLRYAAYADEKGGDPQYDTVKGCQVRSTSA